MVYYLVTVSFSFILFGFQGCIYVSLQSVNVWLNFNPAGVQNGAVGRIILTPAPRKTWATHNFLLFLLLKYLIHLHIYKVKGLTES